MILKLFKSKSSLASVALAACAGILLNACKPENPMDGVQVKVNSDLIKTSYAVIVEDAATGQPITTDVNVSIVGQNQNLVVNAAGTNKTSFKTAGGFTSFGVQPGVVPSVVSPIKFNIIADAGSDYVSSSYPVTITRHEKNIIKIKLVKISAPPSGVTAIINNNATISTSTGLVTSPITVTTPTTNGSFATVEIPAGIGMTSANGTPLSGALTTKVAYFNNRSESALQVFPGGMGVTANNAGTLQNGFFTSAGFVSIEITDQNHVKASNFNSGTIKTSVRVSSETPNPVTGSPVKAGDTVPVWSYDPNTGKWTAEGSSTVVDQGGNLILSKDMSHLSYWNFDWWGTSCDDGASITFTSANAPTSSEVLVKIYNNSNGEFITSHYQYLVLGEKTHLYRVPSIANARVEIYDGSFCSESSAKLAEQVINLCSGDYTMALNYSGSTYTNVKVKVSGYCPNDPKVLLKPSLWAYYRDADSPCSSYEYVYLLNGEAQAQMILGHNYEFYIYYEGQVKWTTQKVTNAEYNYENVALPSEACK